MQLGEVARAAAAARDDAGWAPAAAGPDVLFTTAAGRRQRAAALAAVSVSAVVFVAVLPFAKQPLTPVWGFIPAYQSALALNDLITAALLFGQFAILRSRGLLYLASAYLFACFMAIVHALSFPGLFSAGGLLGAGPQTTAWLYMFWHAGFPLLVLAYAMDGQRQSEAAGVRPLAAIGWSVAASLAAAGALTVLATAGQNALPPIMRGNQYTGAMLAVVSTVWLLSFAALGALWRRRPHSVLDLWLAVVMCAWLFDIGLAAVFNAGRFDLGFYAGRLYGLAAASFVLVVLLLDHSVLYARLARSYQREAARLASAERNLSRHRERLHILHQIDRAIVEQQSPEAIAAAVIGPLRELLGVPRAIVNKFDLEAGEVEWIAAAGRRRMHVGPGVRYSIRLMGEVDALRRGEPQRIDVHALSPGAEREALLASDVHVYMVMPMVAGGELIGALSFGARESDFPPEQLAIAQEVATQLAIAIAQARLHERVRRHAEELERRVAERTAELDAANRGYEDLYNNAPCGYHSVDRDGKFVRMNDTELRWLGYAREELIGRLGPADLHTPESLKLFRARFAQFKQTGVARDVEYELRRKDGSVLPVLLNATAVRDANGEFVMSRSTVLDDTERKRAREEIQAANQELESFSYSVSHDLRAPLRAVDGFARIIEEDYGGRLDDEGRRLLGVVRASSRHMGQLIDDLLDFSRLGRLAIDKRRVDMEALAREVAAELPASSARVEIAALPPAHADRALLRQVWSNLLGNALKYSGKRPDARVEVGGREEAAEAVYWVRDNGVGFDMRYAQKLFGVFQRLHGMDEFPGTGVGLAIVQRVVSRHGGRVWAEGRVGEGACFHFALPRQAHD